MSAMKIAAPLVVTLLLGPAGAARGQSTSAAAQLKIKLDGLAEEIVAASTKQEKINAFDPQANIDTFALALALRKSEASFVVQAEEARMDKQVGGNDESSGSTSLTSKGSVPAILGLAVENGALIQSVSGTTITFRGNPVGLIKAFGGAGFIESYREEEQDPATRILRRLSFALSFDTSRGVQSTGTGSQPVFTGDRQQLSSYSVRFDVVNHRDPRDRSYTERWSQLTTAQLTALNRELQKIGSFLEKDPAFLAWHDQATEALAAAAATDVPAILSRELFKLADLKLAPEVERNLDLFLKTFAKFLDNRDQLLALIAKGGIVTLEYTSLRPLDQPSFSNVKLIAETSAFNGKADLTANAAVNFFNQTPVGPDTRRLRDYQASAQLDLPLGDPLRFGSFVLSFSGKIQHLMSNTPLPGGTTLDTKGNITLAQLKLTVPVKGSGVKIPLSITYSNRTELIKENEVRGNIGITFDIDSLFARLSP